MSEIIRRPSPFVLAATGHGTLIVNRNDYNVAEDGVAYGVGHQLLNTGYFDPEEVSVAVGLLRLRRQEHGDGVVAIDCGANVGVHTVEWAKAMHGWGRVIAIEAQERIYYALAGNIAINNCFNASALHAAVGSGVGTIDVPLPDYTVPASFGSLELRQREGNEFIGQPIDYAPERLQSISLVSIDSLGLERVDLIKLDVEGMELEALEGTIGVLRAQRPIMLVESIKVNRDALLQLLQGLGYATYQSGIYVTAVHLADPCTRWIRVKSA